MWISYDAAQSVAELSFSFKVSALSISVVAEILIAPLSDSSKDSLSCGIFVNLSGDLFVGELNWCPLTHPCRQGLCVCVRTRVCVSHKKRQ